MSQQQLRDFVRVYDADLTDELCDLMVDSFESLSASHEPNGRGKRIGLERSLWTELNVTRLAEEDFLGHFRSKIDQALQRFNREVQLSLPVPNSPKLAELILKRYQPGGSELFQLHFDSIYEVSNRYLVFLWYLNDVTVGGETYFPDLNLTISAKRGRLLVFPPYWMFQHTGLPPTSGPKYILSTYLVF